MKIAPVLDIKHLQNCKILPTRYHMLDCLAKGGRWAEVGVAEGEFSQAILDRAQPETLYLVDYFSGFIAYMPFSYDENTHQEFINNRFKDHPVKTLKGISWEVLAEFPDNYFDFIYIDASHDYESVKKDIQAAKNKVKDGGLLVFNDYTICDHLNGHHGLGVPQAVNEFCIQDDWEFVYFALQYDMYCDVAIRKI